MAFRSPATIVREHLGFRVHGRRAAAGLVATVGLLLAACAGAQPPTATPAAQSRATGPVAKSPAPVAQSPAPVAQSPVAVPGGLVLTAVHPSSVRLGDTFNVQPDGSPAIWIEGENFTRETVIIFGETQLNTAYGGERGLTAGLPAALFARVGSYPVYLRDGSKESNKLTFVVEPR